MVVVYLAREGIQPVWLKVQNRESIRFVLPPMVIDHEYCSPMEAAWQVHGWLTGATHARIDAHFRALRLPVRIGPGETVSGFVFTNLDEGVKYVSIELLGSGAGQVRRFNFLADIPGLKADYHALQGKKVYAVSGDVLSFKSIPYRFGYVAASLRSKQTGAKHTSELPYLFSTLEARYGQEVTAQDREAARVFHTDFADFAQYGDPNEQGLPPASKSPGARWRR
jgi:Carboxylesterase family